MTRAEPRDGRTAGAVRPGLALGAATLVTAVVLLGVLGTDDPAPSPVVVEQAVPAAPVPGPTTRPTGTPTAAAGTVAPAQTAGVPRSQTRTAVPTRILLPNGAVVPVDRADLDRVGALALPEDPSRAGWWTGGARVGEPFGSVVVAGHIDSRRYGIGELAALRDVAVGDLMSAGDGDVAVRYRIESVQRIPKADLSRDSELFDQARPHRLVLITCDGRFDSSTRRYADNLVVTAVPVP
jgi:hypothetical protein